MTFIYNSLLFLLAVLYAPIHLVKLCFSSKYRHSTFARLGFQKIAALGKGPRYWIHAVSVGENQVAKTLTAEILERQPNAQIVISTITETGQAVARSIQGTAATFYYPLDFSFLASSMLNKVKPNAVFIVETDLWFNFLDQCRRRKTPVFLVNGKVSETTLKRYQQFPKLAARLLAPFHHFFVQSQTYKDRFEQASIPSGKVSVAGNVKLDNKPPQMSAEETVAFAASYGLSHEKPLITFGSTHVGEEELALEVYLALKKEFPNLQVALVPRHPERFNEIAEMLQRSGVGFRRASQKPLKATDFILVDEMGVLMNFYSFSTVGVVAGTFTPHVGGHNILEPSFYGKPFVYGPWIYKQPGFHQMNLDFEAGVQCVGEELVGELRKFLKSPELCEEYGKRGLQALSASKGATSRILDEVMKELSKNE